VTDRVTDRVIGGVVVRPAREEDVVRLVEIEEASFEGHRIARPRFARMLRHPTRPLLVAESGGRVVGYASLLVRRAFPEARLYSIAVDPEFRGRSAGSALLDAAESAARDHGCASVRLEVSPSNAAALALYRSRGFAEVRRWPDWYGRGCPALVLRKAGASSSSQETGSAQGRRLRSDPES